MLEAEEGKGGAEVAYADGEAVDHQELDGDASHAPHGFGSFFLRRLKHTHVT